MTTLKLFAIVVFGLCAIVMLWFGATLAEPVAWCGHATTTRQLVTCGD